MVETIRPPCSGLGREFRGITANSTQNYITIKTKTKVLDSADCIVCRLAGFIAKKERAQGLKQASGINMKASKMMIEHGVCLISFV